MMNLFFHLEDTYQLIEFAIELVIYILTAYYFSTSLYKFREIPSNDLIPYLGPIDLVVFKLSLA
jgi:hypothetical protein